MYCPRTNGKLKPIKVGGITVDVSENCGGVFFDNHELNSFDQKHEVRGEVLVDHLSQFTNQLIDETKRINCPKCDNIVMMRRYYSPQKLLEIDECPSCGGIWLDSGELKYLREIFITEEESLKFVTELISEAESHPDVARDKKEFEKSIARMKMLTDFFWRLLGVRNQL